LGKRGRADGGDLASALKRQHGELDGDADGAIQHHRRITTAGEGATQAGRIN